MVDPSTNKSTLVESFRHALEGIASASAERNFRIECGFAVLAIALGFAFRISLPEWLAVVICIGTVLGFECANTALESLVDLASPEIHPLAKKAKDCAAGAVLVVSIASFVVGVVLFAPRILSLIGLFG